MYKELVINDTAHETRVALLEDGNLAEIFVERTADSDIAGNIYKGRVQRVLPGMQAAFVDLGIEQAAFIYVDDVIRDNLEEIEAFLNGEEEKPEIVEAHAPPDDPLLASQKQAVKIEDLIVEGQEILVQVAKSPIGTKGARVTTRVALPGRFLVLMPTSDHVGVSRKIEDESERSRLKSIVQALRRNNFGYIVRTASEGIHEEKLAYEMNFLINLWHNTQEKFKSAPAPSLLHRELTLMLRAVRDLLTHEADKLIIDSRTGFESILSFLGTFMPRLKESVEFYQGKEPVFDAYNLEGDISRALRKKVWLKSGGYIIIEHTEALVAIDVNTGRYVGKHNLEETILKTNLEAVKEIAYQLRLRDLGGIIIIDFIDMEKKANQEKVFNALKEALVRDRSKTHVLPMSELGLIQMTRKRIRKPLIRLLCEPCHYCEGEGYNLSRESICYNLYREVLRQAQDMDGVRLSLRVNPEIAELLHVELNHIVTALEQKIGKPIVIYPDQHLHMEAFQVTAVISSKPS